MEKARKNAQRHLKHKGNIFWVVLPILFISTVLLGATLPGYFLKLSPPTGKSTVGQDAKRINGLCRNSNHIEGCIADSLYELTQKNDSEYATETLIALQQINPDDTRGCHFMAHKISQAETEKDPSKWKEVIKKVPTALCTGGFMHGVLESHLATDPEFTINDKSIEYICRDLLGEMKINWFAEQSCSHNMGHLMLTQEEGKIPQAVNNCMKIKDDLYRFECLSGSFMENLTRENLMAHGVVKDYIPWNKETAEKLKKMCGEYSDIAAQACWQELSFVFFSMHNHDANALYNECQEAPTQDAKDACFIYGAGNMVNYVKFSPKRLLSVCSPVQSDNAFYDTCIHQIIGSLLASTTDNLKSVTDMCNISEDKYKKTCFGIVFENLKSVSSSSVLKKQACSATPKDIRTGLCSV